MKTSKKSILLSGLSLAACAAMLVGTTFAWFTDSVSNKNNRIQAGRLSIEAAAYKLEEGKDTFSIPGLNGGASFGFSDQEQNLKTDPTPVIQEAGWAPGIQTAKLLRLTNGGSLDAKVKLLISTDDHGLMDALWFDFVKVDAGNQIVGTFEKKPMAMFEKAAEALGEIVLPKGESLRFILLYGMDESAGNSYQDRYFEADIHIVATQNRPDAAYPTVATDETIADVLAQAQPGDAIAVAGPITQPLTIDKPLSLTAGGGAAAFMAPVTVSAPGVSIQGMQFREPKTRAGSSEYLLTATGADFTMTDCTVEMAGDSGVGLRLMNSATLRGCTFKNGARSIGWSYAKGDVLIEDCTFSGTGQFYYAVHFDGGPGKVTIRNCGISAYLLAFAADVSEVVLEGNTLDTYVNVYTAFTLRNNIIGGKTDFDFKKPNLTLTSTGDTWNVTSFSGEKGTAVITIDGKLQTFN